ncbi:hypothetical protein BJ875DRAFT_379729 [Amylocarpus encephaloides]|uniref:Transmembrane protein n=1 Tax=Amylocarpus encephaloides TaxID=45428 RepID=A0A9P7YGP7_9HELO|nr:hypothetical protein BJ875DRAFT_379729 [Amylocarpus encephaloides]
MLSISSPFVDSSISVEHNAVKALIFASAQFLLAFSVLKCFSLIASFWNLFASYLMFTEDPIQNFYFLRSRGLSGASFVAFSFACIHTAASLYGTLLWGLDAPGYILKSEHVNASQLNGSLLESPSYINYLNLRPEILSTIEQTLPSIIGANLYKPGVNFSLTAEVVRGHGEYTKSTNPRANGRVWLDSEGLSVSVDNNCMTSYMTDDTGHLIPLVCPMKTLNESSTFEFDCFFNNTFVPPLLTVQSGQPIVYWDDVSDREDDSRYLKPDRKRNIWASFGQGGGTATMKQVFTVTRGMRRHTFIETTSRFTMLTQPRVPFTTGEVDDFLRRTWSVNATERDAPILTKIHNSIMSAQTSKKSYQTGFMGGENITSTGVSWQFLTPESDGDPIYSLIRISVTNITLIRSESLEDSPQPWEPCDTTFMNLAYGGVVDDTDCATAKQGQSPRFFGQVDTAAVLIVYGIGDGRSNISSVAVDETVFQWAVNNSQKVDDLLLARAFIVSIDPSLVTLEVNIFKQAISYLQICLVLLAVFFAGVSYTALQVLSTPHWSNSLLANLLAPVDVNGRKLDPGYIKNVPRISLRAGTIGTVTTVEDLVLGFVTGGPDFSTINVKHVIPNQDTASLHEADHFLPHDQLRE